MILSAEHLGRLAERLAKLGGVTRFDAGSNKEAWTLAHGLSDIEESFRNFLDKSLPKLVDENGPDGEMEAVLHEIGEEFRHILYHLKDMKFFQYLWPEQ